MSKSRMRRRLHAFVWSLLLASFQVLPFGGLHEPHGIIWIPVADARVSP